MKRIGTQWCSQAFSILLLLASPAWATTRTWQTAASTNDWWVGTNWSGGATPGPGDTVIITNANAGVVLTNGLSGWLDSLIISNRATLIFSNWNTALIASNVFVATNAVMTCAGPFTNNAMSNRVYIVCSNLTLDTGGTINVDLRGYHGGTNNANGQGPGGGTDNDNQAGGGAYGGAGGDGYIYSGEPTYGGLAYGSSNGPALPGSGGGTAYGLPGYGGHGGGAVQIEAAGAVILNGLITANSVGSSPDDRLGAGGSGGGCVITCHTFTGTGMIRANGGGNNQGGGGGGGRIAVIYDSAAQGSVAKPRVQFSVGRGLSSSMDNGQLGTLWFPDTQALDETWLPHTGRLLIPVTNWAVNSLLVTNGWLVLPNNFTLTVSNNLTITETNGILHTGSNNIVLVYGNLVLTNRGSLYAYGGDTNAMGARYGSLIDVRGDLHVASNSWICPYSDPTNITMGSVLFQMNNLLVTATNAGFNADGKGYRGNAFIRYTVYNGQGPGGGVCGGSEYGNGGGGGYGGGGGTGAYAAALGGAIYGSSNAPYQPGSGGAARQEAGGRGGWGGGLVWIEAQNEIVLNGIISANGLVGKVGSWNSGGGGSGGGIYVRCHTISGNTNGLLRANGANGNASCGGGGGGRIAVWRIYTSFSGSAAATNGTTGNAASGTIVWGQLPPPGTIILVR